MYALHHSLTHPQGIVIHSSIIPYPYLRKYIRPSKDLEGWHQIFQRLGCNWNSKDYNHTHRRYGFHFWIGLDKNDNLLVVKTLPTTIIAWHDEYIHICICEKHDEKYLEKVYPALIELCTNICKELNWNADKVFYNSEIKNMDDPAYWLYSPDILRKKVQENLTNEKF